MASNEDIFVDETNNETVKKVIKDGVMNYNAPYFGSQ